VEAALGERREGRRQREALPAFLLQRLPVDAGEVGVARADRLARQRVVGIAEAVLRESHARGELPEHLRVGPRLAHGAIAALFAST
jgi:hypothetical protein